VIAKSLVGSRPTNNPPQCRGKKNLASRPILAIGQGHVDPDRQCSAAMPQLPNAWQLQRDVDPHTRG